MTRDGRTKGILPVCVRITQRYEVGKLGESATGMIGNLGSCNRSRYGGSLLHSLCDANVRGSEV